MYRLALLIAEVIVALLLKAQESLHWLLGRLERPKEVVYKGSRPNPPTAVAVVWAEETVQESAVRQLADIFRWCKHDDMETFCIYDSAGELKAMLREMQVQLGEDCEVQVGWREERIGDRLMCKPCRAEAEAQGSPLSGTTTQTENADPGVSAPGSVSSLGQKTEASEPEPHHTTLGTGAGAGGTIKSAEHNADLPGAAAIAAPGVHSTPIATQEAAAFTAGFKAGSCDPELLGCLGSCCSAAAAAPPACGCGLCASGQADGRGNGCREHDEGVTGCGVDGARCNGRAAPLSAQRESGSARAACGAPTPPCAGPRAAGAAAALTGGRMGRAAGAALRRRCEEAATAQRREQQEQQHQHQQPVRGEQPVQREAGAAQTVSLGQPPRPSQRRRIRVLLLSAEDGYEPILQAVRTGGVCSVCGTTLPLKGGSYREGLERLRGQMSQLGGPAVLVQPELVLVVGPALTLAGYPPFQVATSEILHLGPSRTLCQARVDAAWAKFLRTEQRFGA